MNATPTRPIAPTSTDSARWDRILSALVAPHAESGEAWTKPRKGPAPHDAARIVILDRPTACTVLVQWSSAVGCHYGEQIWRKVVARHSGVCALTGCRIARGDAVFRPGRARAACSNAAAMIRASSLDEAACVAA